MRLRNSFAKFRKWQQTPRSYSDQGLPTHHCANCGHEFVGNFCPICGQKGTQGSVSWKAVQESIMNLWNVDSHSLPITMWQLLLRPGYLISEFINGRRQVSFPPLNMLFTIAVGYVFIMYLCGESYADVQIVQDNTTLFETATNWLSSHPAWGMLSVTMIMILPTWTLFHFAPRNPHHTLPKGIFIQLFMSSLMFFCLIFAQLFSGFILLIPFYYYAAYRQLFGYRFWGTMWRLLLSAIIWFSIIVLIAMILIIPSNLKANSLLHLLIADLFMVGFIVALLMVGYWISKHSARRRKDTTKAIQQ